MCSSCGYLRPFLPRGGSGGGVRPLSRHHAGNRPALPPEAGKTPQLTPLLQGISCYGDCRHGFGDNVARRVLLEVRQCGHGRIVSAFQHPREAEGAVGKII